MRVQAASTNKAESSAELASGSFSGKTLAQPPPCLRTPRLEQVHGKVRAGRRHLYDMLNFKFMRHDKWARVLFVHFPVPPHLEPLLLGDLNGTADAIVGSDTFDGGRFVLDRYTNGKAYVGMILLTEVNVGPIVGRSLQRLLVTHHGANIRTYVKPNSVNNVGVGESNVDDEYLNLRGITFASLECDDAITAAGANVFGMPYQVAQMERSYLCQDRGEVSETSVNSDGNVSNKDHQALIRNNALSTAEVDDLMCGSCDDTGGHGGADSNGIAAKIMGIKSARPASSRTQGLFGKIKGIGRGDAKRHKSKIVVMPSNDDGKSSPQLERLPYHNDGNEKERSGFSIVCEWENHDEQLTDEERGMADFFCERYHVYTKKYGLHWKGTVLHEPWPVQKAKIRKLMFSNIDQYEPLHMRPVLRHMANTSPDSILFSEGVGPVDFQMLMPI